LNTAILNELPPASQLITTGFHARAILTQGRHDCVRRDFSSRHAHSFKCSLLIWIEMVQLLLDHLPDAVGHTQLDRFNIRN
jgi:hypothetical protein